MIILVTNDDGFAAPGLAAMTEMAARFADPWIVAPLEQQSAQSHAMTFRRPLRIVEHGEQRFGVSGTPADCVFLALHEILPQRPAAILSGINGGENLGDDVHYSGTVAAALEGALVGIPALAASLAIDFAAPSDDHHWDTASHLAATLVPALLEGRLGRHTALNLNVPDLAAGHVRGIRVCPTGLRRYRPRIERRPNPTSGELMYTLDTEHLGFRDIAGSDGLCLAEGYATITPLGFDLTAYEHLPALRAWERPGPASGERRPETVTP